MINLANKLFSFIITFLFCLTQKIIALKQPQISEIKTFV